MIDPCPFCGSPMVEIRPKLDQVNGYARVRCGTCDAAGPIVGFGHVGQSTATQQAIRLWNERAKP